MANLVMKLIIRYFYNIIFSVILKSKIIDFHLFSDGLGNIANEKSRDKDFTYPVRSRYYEGTFQNAKFYPRNISQDFQFITFNKLMS